MNVKQSQIALSLFFLLVAVVFYLFNAAAPMRVDDYLMSSQVQLCDGNGKLDFSSDKITTWEEYFQASEGRRAIWNGRISDNVGSAVFFVGGGRRLFDFINAIMLCLAVAGVAFMVGGKINLLHAAVALISMLFFLPCPDGVLLWACGAINYLWSIPALLCVLYAAEAMQERGRLPRWLCVLAFPCAFLCGCWHEGLGASLAGGLGLYWLIDRLRGGRLPVAYVLILAFILTGFLIPCSSEALWRRATMKTAEVAYNQLIWNVMGSLAGMIVRLGLPLLIATIVLIRMPKKLLSPLGGFIIANFCMSSLVGIKGGWGGAYFFLGIGLTLLILRALREKVEARPRVALSAALMGSALVALVAAHRVCRIAEIHREVMAAPKADQPIPVNLSMWRGEVPFLFRESLPEAKAPYLYPRIGKWNGQPDFYVIYKWFSPAVHRFFADFAQEADDACIIRKEDGCYVMRVPASWEPVGEVNLKKEGVRELVLSERMLLDRDKLKAFFHNRKLDNMDKEWDGRFYYLLLPGSIEDYPSLQVTLRSEESTKIVDVPVPST